MRDNFIFSAQVPADETTLIWKTYQTYQNGDVVSWDQAPVTNQSDEDREKMEQQGLGPYSETQVVNDLKSSTQSPANTTSGNTSVTMSLVAIVLAVGSIGLQFAKQK